jgi:hypothetical protein
LLDQIFVAHSSTGGHDFVVSPVQDTEGTGTLLPMLSRAPNGRLDLLYYRGSKAGDASAELRWAQSSDGVSWSPIKTLQAPIMLITERDGLGWLGDYLGVQSENDAIYTTFADISGPGTVGHVRFGSASAP